MKFRSPAVLAALFVSLASTAAVVSTVVPMLQPTSEPAPHIGQTAPQSTQKAGLTPGRRYQLLFGPDLDVIGALKLPPDVVLETTPTSRWVVAGSNVALGADIRYIEQSEVAKVEFFDGTTSLGTASATTNYRIIRSFAPGTRNITVVVTDTDQVATSAAVRTLEVVQSTVTGEFEGPKGDYSARTLNGWACSTGYASPLVVRVYFDGVRWQENFTANQSNSRSSGKCQSDGTAFGFSIPVTSTMYRDHSGKKVTVKAVSAADGAEAPLSNYPSAAEFYINRKPTVSQPTRVNLPRYGSKFVIGETVTVSATFADADADLLSTEFALGGTKFCSTTFALSSSTASFPTQCAALTSVAAGTFPLSASAKDHRQIEVAAQGSAVEFVSPVPSIGAGTASAAPNYTVTVAGSNLLNAIEIETYASAQSASAGSPRLQTYSGGQITRSSANGGGESLSFNAVSDAERQALNGAGLYVKLVNLTTGLGSGRWTSEARSVQSNQAPTIQLTSPLSGTFKRGEIVSLEAVASDEAGIKSVQFEILTNGSWRALNIPSDLQAPFVHAWRVADTEFTGVRQIRAVARDTGELIGTSPIVSINIAEPAAPSAPPPAPGPDTVSDSVGTTTGEFRVDESGAATYHIPIYAPPGRAGVAPQVALTYSSQAGVGALGKGWSIAGTSMIARCRATTEAGDPESALGPVDLSTNDRFCLDGQRLLEIAAPSGAACVAIAPATVREFRTEIESFQRVCAYTFDATKGPRFFTVERKDGSKSWYGDRRTASTSADGGLSEGYVAATNGAIYAWAQTRLQDSVGNYMDFGYLKGTTAAVDLGEHVLSRIDYTGKLNSTDPQNDGFFASIEFEYEATRTGLRYFAGEALYGNRRLDYIKVTDGTAVLRRYDTQYGTAASGEDRLISLQECRPASPSVPEVCLPATTFGWSTAQYDFSESANIGTLSHGHLSRFEGYKLADIDGDGRQDVVWMKDDDADGTCPTERLHVLLARLTEAGQVRFAPILSGETSDSRCISANEADELPDDTSSGWFLLDYDGDGREDLFLRAPSQGKWIAHRATGNVSSVASTFDFNNNLLGSVEIPASTAKKKPWEQPQLADFNGDGLTDIVYPKFINGVTLHARLMERNASNVFGWGAERTLDFFGDGQLPCTTEPGAEPCFKVLGLYRRLNYQQLMDFDADGRSDLLLEIEPTALCTGGGPYPPANPYPPREEERSPEGRTTEGGTSSCPSYVYPYTVQDVLPGTVVARLFGPSTPYPFFSSVYSPTSTSSYFRASFADVNGDGLSDAVFTGGPNGIAVVRMNTGTSFDAPFGSGGTNEFTHPTHAQILDLNGDGMADLAYPDHNPPAAPLHFVGRYGRAEGGFGPEVALAGNRLLTGCDNGGFGGQTCLDRQAFMFGDYDADGAVDFLRIEWLENGDSPFHLSRATTPGKPRDLIETITNGLGAVTNITYLPLTNKAVYRRRVGSRNTAPSTDDRGSPVADLLAPMHVVARVQSSAPTVDDSSAKARVDYRYVGLRVQAGGRGSLGFEQIHSIDATESTHHVVTMTEYEQRFPFVGHPRQTTKTVVAGAFAADDACFAGVAEGCLLPAADAALGFADYAGVTVSRSSSAWEYAISANASVAGGPSPRHVRLAGSTDQTYDLDTGDLLARVVNTFKGKNQYGQAISGYDVYGNLKYSETQTFGATGAALYTVATDNTYTDNYAKWYLGRLTTSIVAHKRPKADNPSIQDTVSRRTDFVYDTLTGILTMEETQRGGTVAENLRKFHVLNDYGVRVRTHTCSSGVTETDCKAIAGESGFAFQPSSADRSRVQRYVRQSYDTSKRYVDETIEPFASVGVSEWPTVSVTDRDEYGNVTDAVDLHGVRSRAAFGRLGRPYYAWTQTSESGTGVASLTTYRWCGSAIACPAGARYREEVTRDGAPRQTTYYDVLARPVFVQMETFNSDIGKQYSGVCTGYDVRGRAASVSVPMFLQEQSGVPILACSSYRATTTFDALGRAKLTTNPDGSTQQVEYLGLAAEFTDALAKSRWETRNPMGELTSSIDANGLELRYAYDAAGNATSITRYSDSGAIGDIVSSVLFDASGRKTSQSDIDAGNVTYTYNALGELLTQTRADGSRTVFAYDARGRITQRETTGGAKPGSTHAFIYDTLAPGTLRSESSLFGNLERVQRWHEHDSMGRLVSTRVDVGTSPHVTQIRYDALGRPWKQQDASGRWLKTEFTTRGFAVSVCDSTSSDTSSACSAPYQQTLETDARGNVVKEQRGGTSAMTVTRSHDYQTGRLLDVSAGTGSATSTNHAIYHETYEWDVAGNLKFRDKAGQYKEKYTYDDLHRLKKGVYLRLLSQPEVAEASAPTSFELFYDKLGNICRRVVGSQTSDYHYDGRAGCGSNNLPGTSGGSPTASPHAVTGFEGRLQTHDALGNQDFASYGAATLDRAITYTADQQAYEIVKGNRKTRFVYGTDGQRAIRQDFNAGVLEATTQYVGNVEIVATSTQTKLRRYVAGVAVQEISSLTSAAPTTTTKYLFHDHLGSIVRATNSAGAVLEGMDYGPFGERRGYVDPRWTASAPAATNRGFTGHEMLDGLDVVHMNGRVYDSRTWRFLQADPIVQAPNNAQSLNRYSYVWNNPLNATDPSGFVVQRQPSDMYIFCSTAISIAITSAFGTTAEGVKGFGKVGYAAAGGYTSGYIASGSGQGGLQGAYTGVLFLGAGAIADNIVKGGLTPGHWGRAMLHGFAGGVSADISGGHFGHGFASAGMSKFLMGNFVKGKGPGSMVAAAIIGGSVSVATGGKFANGAVTGALQFAFNQMQSEEYSASYTEALSEHGAQMMETLAAPWGGVEGFKHAVGCIWSCGLPGDGSLASNLSALPPIVGVPLRAGSNAGRGGAAMVRIGGDGETAVKAAFSIGAKFRIAINGRTRIPDGLTSTVLSEVKNVRTQGFTRQLRDFADFAQQTGRRFDLYVRPTTRLSGPLQDAIAQGTINLRLIP